jgi:hypothetical protein
MNFVLDGKFEWFLEKFGKPQKNLPVNDEQLNRYRGQLPERLLEYWQEYGFCCFKDGLFWIVNPDDYQDTMEAWLSKRLKQ